MKKKKNYNHLQEIGNNEFENFITTKVFKEVLNQILNRIFFFSKKHNFAKLFFCSVIIFNIQIE
jgi:hypothetical protein